MCCLLFFVCFDFSEFGSQKEKVEFFTFTTDFKAFFFFLKKGGVPSKLRKLLK